MFTTMQVVKNPISYISVPNRPGKNIASSHRTNGHQVRQRSTKGNHNGIDAEQREYIADSIVEFLVSAVKR